MFGNFANSQTTTINYLNSGLSTSACNVFSPAVTISGIQHTSRAGGVNFNSNVGLGLFTTPQTSPPGGTAYVINYNFVPGNNYNISITALGSSALQLKTSVVPNFNQFPTNGTTSCTPDPNVSSYIPVGYAQFSTATSTTSTTYNVPQFSIPGNTIYQYLIVWVSGGQSNFSLDGLSISKIVISQTSNASFTLSPSAPSISCGSAIPQIFTVANVNNTANVSNHIWNLVSANNGWLYNGNPAPQTVSTGTINTLTLTPVCGAIQTDISAVVTANSNTYNTNSTNISRTQPTMSINGSGNICDDPKSYFIDNLPCNSTVSWSALPSGIVNISVINNQATLTKITEGNITLSAAVSNSNACGSNSINLSTPVVIGFDYGAPYEIYGFEESQEYCGSQTYSMAVDPFYDSYTWHIYGNAQILSGQSTDYISIQMDPAYSTSSLFIEVVVTSCGQQYVVGAHGTISNCYYNRAYTIFPNPASNNVTIDGHQKNIIKEIRLVDKLGNIKKLVKYPNDTKSTNFNISGFAPDVYYIKIFNGQTWETHQISKK